MNGNQISGSSNNGFVANTANIDQSNKNTINVYQFGSGVNFNLKLAPGQANNPNMSRKQYEQIQNALNQMSSLEKQDKLNNSIDEKSFASEIGVSKTVGSTNPSKQYPQIQNLNSTGTNFNQIIVPSASSKRSHKVSNSQSVGSNQTS